MSADVAGPNHGENRRVSRAGPVARRRLMVAGWTSPVRVAAMVCVWSAVRGAPAGLRGTNEHGHTVPSACPEADPADPTRRAPGQHDGTRRREHRCARRTRGGRTSPRRFLSELGWAQGVCRSGGSTVPDSREPPTAQSNAWPGARCFSQDLQRGLVPGQFLLQPFHPAAQLLVLQFGGGLPLGGVRVVRALTAQDRTLLVLGRGVVLGHEPQPVLRAERTALRPRGRVGRGRSGAGRQGGTTERDLGTRLPARCCRGLPSSAVLVGFCWPMMTR